MYPDISPIWFSESEDTQLVSIVECVNSVKAEQHLLVTMTKSLVAELYKLRKAVIPADIMNMNLSVIIQVKYTAWFRSPKLDINTDKCQGLN